MGNSPTAPATGTAVPVPATTHQSFLQKIEGFFKTLETDIVNVEDDVLGKSAATSLNATLKSILEGPLGTLAQEAVTAAANVAAGTLSFSGAASAIATGAKAAGKTVEGSITTSLIAAAQAALEAKLGTVLSVVA